VVVRCRHNYVCENKLAALQEEHDAETALGMGETQRAKRRLKVLQHAADHDLIAGGPEGIEQLSQSSCPGRQDCDHADTCRYYTTRDEAAYADLVVTSHAMVFASLDYPRQTDNGPEYWFPMDTWIADEGDQLIDAVQDNRGVSGWGLRAALNDARCGEAACDAIRRFIDNLHGLLGRERSIELDQRQWQQFIANRLPVLRQGLEDWRLTFDDADEPQGRVALRNLVHLLETMDGDNVRAGFVVNRKRTKRDLGADDKRIVELDVQCRFITLGETLHRYARTFNRFAAVSGSVALPTPTDMSFEFFDRRSRLAFTATHAIRSPIDYDANLRIVYAPISERNRGQRAKVFAQLAANTAEQVGNCLVLCTSYDSVRAVQEAFEARGLPILAQDRDSNETVAALAAQVKTGTPASIVGNKSAWIGLDLDARFKTVVIIEKVPVPSPSIDLVLAGYLRKVGAAAWGETYGRPQALKQAVQRVGRTLRRESDQCLLIVCDERFRGDYALAIPGGREVTFAEGIEWARSIKRSAPSIAQPVDSLVDDMIAEFDDFLEGV
jgi:Rad3-related DNA helicase